MEDWVDFGWCVLREDALRDAEVNPGSTWLPPPRFVFPRFFETDHNVSGKTVCLSGFFRTFDRHWLDEFALPFGRDVEGEEVLAVEVIALLLRGKEDDKDVVALPEDLAGAEFCDALRGGLEEGLHRVEEAGGEVLNRQAFKAATEEEWKGIPNLIRWTVRQRRGVSGSANLGGHQDGWLGLCF